MKTPTYHRQKLLLFLLEQAGNTLTKLDFQKLLFLYVQESETSHYAFVPFRFGCYSFQAADDLDLLCKRGWLIQKDKEMNLSTPLNSLPWAQTSPERSAVGAWLRKKTLRGNALIREVYRRYPYYAIHSEIKEQLLDETELARVQEEASNLAATGKTLFTIGYEGLHFEEYLNKLIKNGVRLLCDVRRNPLSRKFGFGQRSLATILPKMGIEYQHLPELGIEAVSRKHLESPDDYAELFDAYRKTLPDRQGGLANLRALFRKHERIALTCFEREPHMCHRHCITDYLARHDAMTVRHL